MSKKDKFILRFLQIIPDQIFAILPGFIRNRLFQWHDRNLAEVRAKLDYLNRDPFRRHVYPNKNWRTQYKNLLKDNPTPDWYEKETP